MKRWMMVLFCVTFSFLFCLMCVGYAQLSDSLVIEGTAEASEPAAVYIVEIVSTTGTVTRAEVVPYTSVDSDISLGTSDDATVTMRICVKNNTAERYGFNAVRYAPDLYTNSGIAVSTDMTRKTVDKNGNVTANGTIVEPGQTLEFTATFSYADGYAGNADLSSLINYEFLPWDSISADVDLGLAEDVMGKFQDILNNAEIADSCEQLIKQMENNEEADRSQPNYIANFTAAHPDDTAVLETLFGSENMKVTINGVETEVKVMIKHKNVTNAYSGDEMVLYMTTHSLIRDEATKVTTERNFLFTYTYRWAAPIYAAVFAQTQNANGETVWVQVGSMYTGEGQINGYDGTPGYDKILGVGGGEGSFDTETWISTEAYGSAAVGSDINTVIAANT